MKKNDRCVLWDLFVNTLQTLDEELFNKKGYNLESCPVLDDYLAVYAIGSYKDVEVYVEYNDVPTTWRPKDDEYDKEDEELITKAGKLFVCVTNTSTYERKVYNYAPGTYRQDGEFLALLIDKVKEMATETPFDEEGVKECVQALGCLYGSLANLR